MEALDQAAAATEIAFGDFGPVGPGFAETRIQVVFERISKLVAAVGAGTG